MVEIETKDESMTVIRTGVWPGMLDPQPLRLPDEAQAKCDGQHVATVSVMVFAVLAVMQAVV